MIPTFILFTLKFQNFIINSRYSLANEQQILFDKISKVKSTLVESDSDIKNLLLYMKEAEQVLSSAVYQSRIKLDMIAKAKPISSDLIIKYAHKISTDFGVCCPENWTPDNQRRPYPTDSDMRKGWLGKINDLCTIPALDEDEAQRASLKANSKGNFGNIQFFVWVVL